MRIVHIKNGSTSLLRCGVQCLKKRTSNFLLPCLRYVNETRKKNVFQNLDDLGNTRQ